MLKQRVWSCGPRLIGLVTASGPAAATELTILWAEWDPANYLQELVNEYSS